MGVTGEALGRESVLVLVLACELGRGHGRGSLLTRERQAAEWKLGGLLARTPRGFTCRRERRNIPSAMTVGMGKQRFWSAGVGLVFVVAWERLSGLQSLESRTMTLLTRLGVAANQRPPRASALQFHACASDRETEQITRATACIITFHLNVDFGFGSSLTLALTCARLRSHLRSHLRRPHLHSPSPSPSHCFTGTLTFFHPPPSSSTYPPTHQYLSYPLPPTVYRLPPLPTATATATLLLA
jgi:hypothetical protein